MVEVVSLLEERVVRLIQEVEALRTAKNQLETENDGLKITVADYDQTKADLETLTARAAELEIAAASAGQLETVKTELEAARARIAQLEEWHDGACRSRDEAQSELDVARELLAFADTEKAEIAAGREEMRVRIEELEARVNANAEMEKELESLRGAKAEMEEQLAAARQRDEETRERLNGLIERIENAEQALLQVEMVHEPV
ncbi:MAG: hypothetical protein PWP23_502 [Candidatus Sumerlaeota bacterium]|nr:hypothetical protein [Candidatus Sumerlaeota bacterium]